MLSQVRRDQAQVHEFPGRDWLLYVGPETSPAKNMTVGFVTFPEWSPTEGLVHPTQEGFIHIVSGQSEL